MGRVIGRVLRVALMGCALAAGAPAVLAQPGATPPGSSSVVLPVVERARALMEQGTGDEARALLDSLVGAQRAGSMELAEAVYWRGVLAERVADAERDWKRLVIEVPLSPRTADALVRLAELEMLRGRADAAAGYYERVVREFPSGMARTKSLVWLARTAMDRRETAKGCEWLGEVRTAGVEGELRLQLEGMEGKCTAGGPTAGGPTAGSPTAGTPTAGTPTAGAPTAGGPTTGSPTTVVPTTVGRGRYSVQLAAYTKKGEAEGLVARLRAKGIEARVDGDQAPFRVRVDRYVTRAEAAKRLGELKAQGFDGFVAELPRAGGTR